MASRRIGGAFAALGVAAALAAAAPAGGQAAAGGCPGAGHVLARRDGIVVFSRHRPDSRGNAGPVFVCRASGGAPIRVRPQSSTPRVADVRAAGRRYVGFFLWTNEEVYTKYLVVFNRRQNRLQFKDLAECFGNDECTGPSMTGYRLARNGWAAELWPDVFSRAAGLLATNGGAHYQLDLTRIRHLTLSGRRLSWASTEYGSSSVRLGPGVVTPAAPGPLSACQLLTSADLTPLLGSGATSSSSSSGNCTYTSSATPGRQLTVELWTGLSPSQVQAAEGSGDYCAPGYWWPSNDNFYDQSACGGSSGSFSFESFANGAEVQLSLVSGPGDGDEQEAHLATVALDRLFGVPITRAT